MRGHRLLVLLRGINVGGRHPVPMLALKGLFAELGCDSVSTYLQSGNLACTAHPSLTPEAMSAAIEERFGFAVPVVTRTAEEFRSAVRANPFAQAGVDSLHTVFFAVAPSAAAVQSLAKLRLGKEDLRAEGREIYLYLPHGFGRSRLALACTAPGLAGTPTVRNWKTVLQLEAMLNG